ncbi:uncharacterized protein KIAA0825 homolog isoform X2 [Corticium candelabrum]|uniref:uncharacterized protein KIAA0825 homolog isoform X2 n=1 Tax=Corticium candelabrum TaxID=121492 RepID=UPI002E26B30A|nr:uncharacterized protein KIAA0825 homolog isoform X2 [Corticium candelabrum]
MTSSCRGEVDEKLFVLERELNEETIELERRARAFVESVRAVEGDGRSIANCGDAVDFLVNSNNMRFDEMEVSVIKEMLAFLATESNAERSGDVVWNQLAHLVSIGLVLPTSCQVRELDEVSLHEVCDQRKDELFTLWQQLRVKLKAWYSSILHALPSCSSVDAMNDKVVNLERQRLVQRLCLLYQPVDTLHWYSQMRKHQLESHSRKLCQHRVSSTEHGKRFSEWLAVAEEMIREDIVVLRDGDFMDAARLKPFEFLSSTYLCVIMDEMKRVSSLLLSSSGVQKSVLVLSDILAFSELVTSCRQLDRFVFKIVMLTHSPCNENASDQYQCPIAKYPVDVQASLKDLREAKLLPVGTQHSDDRTNVDETVDFMWEWSIGFEACVSLLAQCVETVMMSSVQGFVVEEEASCAATGQLSFVSLADSVDCQSSDMPKKITKCCQSIVEIIKSVACIVTVGKSARFVTAVNSFTSILDKVLAPYVDHTAKIASAVPERIAVYNLCLLASSTAYLATTLNDCHEMVKGHSSAPRVAAVYQKIYDFHHDLTHQLIKYHCNICATVVLQDAESNFYSDPKPFHEDERSSFSIQMWNYYLQGLKHDFWMSLSPCLAKLAIGNIMVEGLRILSGRHSRAEVSEAREKQYRTDVVAILSIASHFVWAVCDAGDLLAYQTAATHWIETSTPSISTLIWNHCNMLGTCLVYQSAPVTSALVTSEAKSDVKRDWLEITEPQLFKQERRVSDVRCACVKAKWLLEQPAVSHLELLELLTMNECIIPKTLCQSRTFCSEELLTSLWDILLLLPNSQTFLSRTSILDLVRVSTTSQGSLDVFEAWLVSKLTVLVVEDAACLPVFLLCHKATESDLESKLFSSTINQVPSRLQSYLPANDPINLVSEVSACLIQVFNKLRTDVSSLPSMLVNCLKQLDIDSPSAIETIFVSCCQETIRKLFKAKIITDLLECQMVVGELESQLEALKRDGSIPNCGNKVIGCLRNVVEEIRSLQVSGTSSIHCRLRDIQLIKNREAAGIWISVLQKNSEEVMNLLQATAGIVSLPHLQVNRTEGDVTDSRGLNCSASVCCSEQFWPLQSVNRIGSVTYSQTALENAVEIWLPELQT